MMTILVGPCMFVAPLAAVLAILAIPLWPVAILFVGVTWLLVWPLEQLLIAMGVRSDNAWSRSIARLFMTVLKPWTYFDPPATTGSNDVPGAPE
ncbi:MAG: hypothetical protein U0132_21900 [Gemmatimonadaceae bacterium]